MKSLQLSSPHAIVVIGIQGSGKSFFAGKFAETFNAPLLDEQAFVAAAGDEAGTRLMNDVLNEFLKTGRSIMIEQSLSSRSERTDLTRLLKKAGYVPLYVWVQVDVATATFRSQKSYGVSEDDYAQSLRKFSPPHASEKALVISGKHTFATQAKAVLKKLSVPRATASPQQSPRQQPSRGQIIVR